MNINDFNFQLPESLIAKYPTAKRTASRLLCLNKLTGDIHHKHFSDILEFISPKDLLVVNNSRVIPARVFGQKASGGKLEVLIERLTGSNTALAHIKCSKSPKPNTEIILGDNQTLFKVTGRQEELFNIELLDLSITLLQWLNQYGHMPLPPYIDRPDEGSDQERYQTVYSQPEGSVAAPTAGLHFDENLLDKIKQKGVKLAHVTLHVGAGTFQPVRVDKIEDHHMHHEWIEVTQATCDAINACKNNGGKVIAVGTTSVRSLETAATHSKNPNCIEPFEGDTNIFLYPGKQFHIVDILITNFHLPKSTLLMLVSAFASRETIMAAYKEAIEQQYRFFSYGDAMVIY